MAQGPSRRPAPSDQPPPLSSLGSRAFAAEVARLRQRHDVSGDVRIVRDAFETREELEDFLANYNAGDTVTGLPGSAARGGGATAVSSRSADGRAALDRAIARKAEALARQAATAPARTSPVRTSPARGRRQDGPSRVAGAASARPPLSALVEPGLYHGPPWRLITWKAIPREVDESRAQFRRQRTGIGKCTGAKLQAVRIAFANAYSLAESARQEVMAIRRDPDARILWHGSLRFPEASLAHWFGADYAPQQMNRMLTTIEAILTEWSLAFCAGFRGLLPVWIRCKSRGAVGDGPARHLVANMIELMPSYFEMSRARQIVTMLHEMGHRSTAITTPRDERHRLCSGGWNAAGNMCYRVVDQPDVGDGLFRGGNPRTLAAAAEGGNVDARKTALNNIDNYVCYMWNRDKDRGGNMMQVLQPDAKPTRNATSRRPGKRPTG